jgi:hypothetical protein
MSEPSAEIPQPQPFRNQPAPEIPEFLTPEPTHLGVTTGNITGRFELGISLKVTYRFQGSRLPTLSEEQFPLSLTNEPHDELIPGVAPPMKAVPEVLAYSSGTDIIVRAHARPPRPVAGMKVGVVAGALRHYAKVTGNRYVDREGSRLVFTPPEPFDSMPLRYELAYGGIDREFEARVADEGRNTLTPEELRRVTAVAQDFLKAVPPVAYPRNPYGKGYALTSDPDAILGKELPNIELDNDRLTPQRLWPSRLSRWMEMPVPAGFDYMDAGLFPRTAMMGLPPMADGSLDDIAEVSSGQVPAGFCLGNVMYAEREEIPDLIHAELARCAPIGLRSPFLRGDEVITLYGMDPAEPVMGVHLPGTRPVFRLPPFGTAKKETELDSQLYQVLIDVDERMLFLVWTARAPWAGPLQPGEDKEIASRIGVRQAQVGRS